MKNIINLFQYIKPFKGKLILYVICVLITTFFSLFSFTMIAPVLQVLFNNEEANLTLGDNLVESFSYYVNKTVLEYDKMTALIAAVAIVAAATLLKNVFLYFCLRIMNPLRHTVITRLRQDMLEKTITLPIGFFTEERKGDLVSKMTNDINEVEVSIMSVLETVFREPISIIATLVAMMLLSPQLTLFMFIFLPIAGLIIGKVGKMMKKPSNQAQEQLSRLMSNLDETIGGMRVIKAFNAESYQRNKFTEINNQLLKTKNVIAARRDAGSPLSETLGIMVVCVVLLYGGYLIFNGGGDLSGPYFITYIGLFYLIINPIKSLSNAFFNMKRGTAALDRVNILLNTENNIVEKENSISIQVFNTSIELKNVNFFYGDKQVLKNINLSIPKGQTIALVGSSGAGKSTLADLIPRFHDVTSGEVTIDGVNIKDLNLYAYRQLIGMVNQDPILFNDTIKENIILGMENKTDDEIIEAARIANAHHFILNKENGYDTYVGDRGVKLSGGERQRVTIARAVLKNPPILILDEATSSLDTESEKHVQDAINHLMKNRTSIVIAHRLSTIKNADKIVVMHQGEIVEVGTHDDLWNKNNGYYKNLVELQQLT